MFFTLVRYFNNLSNSILLNYSKKNYSTNSDVELQEANSLVKRKIENTNPNYTNSESFRSLANGVFQSEGSVTARFNRADKLWVTPVVALGQNFSIIALDFFVRLYFELGQIGTIKVVRSLSNNLHITWRVENWQDILTLASYFSLVYGEKFKAFQKLKLIFNLKNQLVNDFCKCQLIHLVYSLASSGIARKISLADKLSLFNLNSIPEPSFSFRDNDILPDFLFILGFLLGDGTAFIRIRLTLKGFLNFIPLLQFPQKNTSENLHFFNLLSLFFASLGIKVNTLYGKDTITLVVEGVKAIYPLAALFDQHKEFFFWKDSYFNLLLDFFKYHSSGALSFHLGILAFLRVVYTYENNRKKSIEDYLTLATQQYLDQYPSNNQFITTIRSRDKNSNEIVAFYVTFSKKLKFEGFTPKYFYLSTFGSHESALLAAIAYRDSILNSFLKSLK